MKYTFDTEHQLWSALGNESPEALTHMYQQYYKIWIGWMTQRGGQQEDGEDIFQEALVVLIQKAKDSEFKLHVQINTFFLTICKRMWYKKLERSPQVGSLNEDYDPVDAQASEVLDEHEEKEAAYNQMHSALNKLGEPCASVLKSYYIDNKSMAEIAELYNYTNADNAKNQKYKCMSRLKKIFFQN